MQLSQEENVEPTDLTELITSVMIAIDYGECWSGGIIPSGQQSSISMSRIILELVV